MRARRSLLIAAALAVAGCTSPATQVIVTIDAEPGVRLDSAQVHIVVLGGVGRTTAPTASRFDRVLTPGASDPAYPIKFVLAPLDGDVGRSYSVTATAETATGGFVGQVRIIGGYVEGETLAVRLLLEDACRRIICGEEQTCRAGVCVAARVVGDVDAGVVDAGDEDASGEDGGDDDAGTLDAGMSDAGMGDGGASDAGTSDGGASDAGDMSTLDGGTDVTVDSRPLALTTRNSFLLTAGGAFASAGDNLFQLRGTPRNASPSGWSFETYTGGTSFVALAATQFTGYGITPAGQLYVWGSNTSGLLGTGSAVPTMAMPAPTRLGTDLWRTIDGGNQHVCGIRRDGRLACWGDRTDGRIGEGSSTGSATAPVVVGAATWLTISAGERHTCGIQLGGSLWCWGYNSTGAGGPGLESGQLGVGDTNPRSVPTRVGVDSDWRSVSAGTSHTCAIKTSGTLWCWGEQAYWGRLGLGATDPGTDVLTPQQVTAPAFTLTAWTVVAAGNLHTCGIAAGDLFCWGIGVRGATGSGTTATDPVPSRSATGYTDVVVGAEHSCGRASTGSYFCWGRITDARTGTGVDPVATNPDLFVPTAVMIF